jgi:predicted nuclease with RNAse H fold
MKIVGIDLSGPRNIADTCLVSFEERGEEIHLAEVREEADDSQILQAVSSLGSKERIAIGIDAPLSYNPGGGDRLSDKELRQLASEKGRVGILSPTMMRMVYLTLRGVALTRMLEAMKPQYDLQIVEVHPGACMLLHGALREEVNAFKREVVARQQLLDWLEEKGMRINPRAETVPDHFVAACAAAFGAWQWALGKSVWRSPADPPKHPYDFAC